ncbi:MAG: rRNA pseudouridine synthase [Planctomycetales bacterium]|nr:rRNA pseudouridine synthase [Planctomycetales bacterium]
MATTRLNRLLASAGYGSRRACDELIAEGRVTVDGFPVRDLGVTVDPEERDVRCDGVRVRPARRVVYAFHKPRGVICTDAPGNAPRAVDFLPKDGRRLFAVGRLDAESSGLLLFTNDGDLANRIAHPRYGVPKTYRVRVKGEVPEADVAQIEHGVWLAEGRTGPARVRVVHRERQKTILLVTIREGRNREVRRVLARLGHRVVRLTRVGIGGLPLGNLKPGRFRILAPEEEWTLVESTAPPARAMEPPWPERRKDDSTRRHGDAATRRGAKPGDAAPSRAQGSWARRPPFGRGSAGGSGGGKSRGPGHGRGDRRRRHGAGGRPRRRHRRRDR